MTLSQRSTALIATVSNPEKSREFERSLTVLNIVETALPICEVKRNSVPGDVERALDIQLTRLIGTLNLKWNMTGEQTKILVEDLIDKYPNESLEDFILVFKRARMGEFGELFRLDGPVVFSWMETYLDEKYAVIEKKLYSEKDNDYKVKPEKTDDEEQAEINKAGLAAWKAMVESITVKKPAPLTDKEIKEEGQIEPKAKPYPYTPKVLIEQSERHHAWIVANHDPYTGKPKPGYMEEEVWLREVYYAKEK